MSWPLVCHLIIMPTCKLCTQASWEVTWTVPRVRYNIPFFASHQFTLFQQCNKVVSDKMKDLLKVMLESDPNTRYFSYFLLFNAKFPGQGQQFQQWKAIHSLLMWIGPRLKRKSSNCHSQSQRWLMMVTLHCLMQLSPQKPFQIPWILKILLTSHLLIPLLALIGSIQIVLICGRVNMIVW